MNGCHGATIAGNMQSTGRQQGWTTPLNRFNREMLAIIRPCTRVEDVPFNQGIGHAILYARSHRLHTDSDPGVPVSKRITFL